ncbi:VOC family protein [Vallitalea pronyensis]|uniref:VOC family protein n=1 Tax=Vallitalea pronyensis TaxID=1348613 RepID=A0A8J8SF90_9FIRM|nr:VOC family protein [Vallitalea pronyensis]QUI20998.1 VOC family protein [Vallitalea pronyensis]
MEFGELCLLTTNVPRLADFYKKVLRTSSDCDSEIHQAITIKGVTLAIYNNGHVKNSKNENMVVAFTVDDVDQAYERLSQLGVKIIEKPTTRPWGARNMYFEDTDGNQVVFRSFPN